MVYRRRDGRKCIEKRLQAEGIRRGEAEFEMLVMRQLNHPNVVEYIHAFIMEDRQGPRASIFMEYCDLGTLDSVLDDHHSARRRLSEAWVWDIFKQLVNALGYIHWGIRNAIAGGHEDPSWVGIIHRDIKPSNVFLCSEGGEPFPRVVLGDFGCSVREDVFSFPGQEVVTGDRNWVPPETPMFGKASDIWMMGAVIQACCRLDGPPARYGPEIREGRRCRGAGSFYSPELSQALKSVMREHPGKRLRVREVAPLLVEWEFQADQAPTDLPWAFFP